MTAVANVFRDDNLRGIILKLYITHRRAYMDANYEAWIIQRFNQREEYDAIVGCISYCSVQYQFGRGYFPERLYLVSIPPSKNVKFPEDYWPYNDPEEYETEEAFQNRHIVAPNPEWERLALPLARQNTEVSFFLNCKENHDDYSVKDFKKEWGKNWRNRHWYLELYRDIFMEHIEYGKVWDLYAEDTFDDINQVNPDEIYDLMR